MNSGACQNVRVLFVCLGNICRSPTAEGVFRERVKQAGLDSRVEIDSAGTGDWHIGRAPDKRAQKFAARAGYDISDLRARQVSGQDFSRFDYVLAMDGQNLADLQQMQPAGWQGSLALFLGFHPGLDIREVPDPYTGDEQAFIEVVELIERGADALLEDIRKKLS